MPGSSRFNGLEIRNAGSFQHKGLRDSRIFSFGWRLAGDGTSRTARSEQKSNLVVPQLEEAAKGQERADG